MPDMLPNAPRTQVSWYEAVAFCKWLELELPYNVELFIISEMEWIAAASGGQDAIYVWGDYEPQPLMVNSRRPFRENVKYIGYKVCPVGIFPAYKHGIYDMCGNVAEWTRTLWYSDLETLSKTDTQHANLLDVSKDARRTVRGCSFRDVDIRMGIRRGYKPGITERGHARGNAGQLKMGSK